jgi:hypothetical protein
MNSGIKAQESQSPQRVFITISPKFNDYCKQSEKILLLY